jgi:hypothetical protein
MKTLSEESSPGNDFRAHADLRALGTDQQWRGGEFRGGIGRVLGDGGAARVVGVHAVTGADEELGLVEGADRGREFRAADAGRHGARIVPIEDRKNMRFVKVAAPAQRRPQPVRPAHGVLRVDANAAFADLVVADAGEKTALIGVA